MQTSYYLGEYIIQQSQSATYLGVKIDQRLKWSEHISSTISKANSANAFLKHNLSGCSSKVKKNCYLSIVRPILEYASIVWLPHTQCDIHKIEMVQQCAVRFIFNNFSRTASVTNMLANLQLPTLECRRQMLKLVMLYCILFIILLRWKVLALHTLQLELAAIAFACHNYLSELIPIFTPLPLFN